MDQQLFFTLENSPRRSARVRAQVDSRQSSFSSQDSGSVVGLFSINGGGDGKGVSSSGSVSSLSSHNQRGVTRSTSSDSRGGRGGANRTTGEKSSLLSNDINSMQESFEDVFGANILELEKVANAAKADKAIPKDIEPVKQSKGEKKPNSKFSINGAKEGGDLLNSSRHSTSSSKRRSTSRATGPSSSSFAADEASGRRRSIIELPMSLRTAPVAGGAAAGEPSLQGMQKTSAGKATNDPSRGVQRTGSGKSNKEREGTQRSSSGKSSAEEPSKEVQRTGSAKSNKERSVQNISTSDGSRSHGRVKSTKSPSRRQTEDDKSPTRAKRNEQSRSRSRDPETPCQSRPRESISPTRSRTRKVEGSKFNDSKPRDTVAENDIHSPTKRQAPKLSPVEAGKPRGRDNQAQPTSSPAFNNGRKSPTGGGDGVLAQAERAASLAWHHFDQYYSLKNDEKEESICLFQGDEIVLEGIDPIRILGSYSEYQLKAISTKSELSGLFSPKMQKARARFMERSMDGSYCIKFVRRELICQPLVGPEAAADIALETRILMNLPGHPNIAPLYGLNQRGIPALTKNDGTLRDGFFMVSDRIEELLPERMLAWKNKKGYESDKSKFSQRLEVALDISSALQFLHDRMIVFHVRPGKIGFDARHSCLKLFNFGEARQDGAGNAEQSRFITQSADLSILRYTAPEVLCNAPATTSSDVYSFAIILWQIISLKIPFEGLLDRQDFFGKVVEKHARPRINSKWPPEIGKLLQRCWDPHLRITMNKVNEELEALLLF